MKSYPCTTDARNFSEGLNMKTSIQIYQEALANGLISPPFLISNIENLIKNYSYCLKQLLFGCIAPRAKKDPSIKEVYIK